MVRVVGAVLISDGRVFICQRPAHKGSGLSWEFPGGKVEAGEADGEALVRECREELEVDIECGEYIMGTVYEYPDITVELVLYEARIRKGRIRLLEHADSAWAAAEELESYALCPADMKLLPEFVKWMKNKTGSYEKK